MQRRCSLLVLNYNGKDLLAEYLPSIVQAVAEDGGDHEVVVVDNASQDGSAEFVERNFPTVRVRRMEANDRLFSYNVVAAEIEREYIFLLNNDVKFVSRDLLRPLLAHFDDPNVFAVMPKVVSDKPSEVYEFRCPGVFSRGYLLTGRWERLPGPGYTLFAHGAAAIFDRRKFLELGGFDRLYWPEYFQDVDISYQAWTRRWPTVFEPESVVFHRGGATIAHVYNKNVLNKHQVKLPILFGLKCLSDPGLFASFLGWRILFFVRAILFLDWSTVRAYADAFKEIPRVTAARQGMQSKRKLSDRGILQMIRSGFSPLKSSAR